MKKINRVTSIIFYILGGISIILAGLFYLGGNTPETVGTSLVEKKFLSVFMVWGVILFVIATVVTLGYSLLNTITNLRSVKSFLILFIGAAVLIVVSYLLASPDPLPNLNMANPPSPTTIRVVGAGLIATCIIAVVAFLTIISTEIIRAFR
jgi:hypothetical protein